MRFCQVYRWYFTKYDIPEIGVYRVEYRKRRDDSAWLADFKLMQHRCRHEGK